MRKDSNSRKYYQEFRVSRVFGSYYEIQNSQTGKTLAKLKGNLRLQNKDERHPIVVGDYVVAEKKSETWMIQERKERKSILLRKSNPRDAHALCANADFAILIASLKEPETKPGFIDRFLASVSISGMEPVLVFTKKDLVSEEEIRERTEIYRNLGYKIFLISVFLEDSFADLKNFIQGKTSFLSGNSGVGKSTLVNALLGEIIQNTNEVSKTTNKGKHTTTNSLAIFLDESTTLIDSPGIKEWGILHLEREELLLSYPELNQARVECNHEYCCNWEENCDILQKLNEISDVRRSSMESMLESLEKPFRTTRRDHWNESESLRVNK